MKLLKDLAAFAVADVAIMFVVCVTVFSGSMTAKVIEQYQTGQILPFGIVGACVILTVLMIISAMMMAYEEFVDFRENNRR